MFISTLSLLVLAASALARKNQTGPSKPELTHLFTVNITTSPAVDIGTTPFGHRVFTPVTGGSFSGPKLEGNVAPGGADWGLVGSNGDFNPDVVYALETHDGDNIVVRQRGHSPNVFSLFETGSDEYAWLNLVVAYGEATVTQTGVLLDFWQVGTISS